MEGLITTDIVKPNDDKNVTIINSSAQPPGIQPGGNQLEKKKRKHRRGKPKNANKPFKKTNWKFQVPRLNNYTTCGNNMPPNNSNNNRNRRRTRPKLLRSNSLVPYNTNKFLMEEHLADVPNSLFTPSGRTRDSSFSVDSEDNYFFSLPEDEEEFLTKEFANVYETARVERLENLTKQQLIEECLQIEDRYSTDQGSHHQQELDVQRISAEYMSKIKMLEEKVRELTRENYNLRCQFMRSAVIAAAAAASASPPSATAPTASACEPTPMDSSSEDSESDSSSSSSSSSSARSNNGCLSNQLMSSAVIAPAAAASASPPSATAPTASACEPTPMDSSSEDSESFSSSSSENENACRRRHQSNSSSPSSLNKHIEIYIENNYPCDRNDLTNGEESNEHHELLEAIMDDDSNEIDENAAARNQFLAAANEQNDSKSSEGIVSVTTSLLKPKIQDSTAESFDEKLCD